MLRKDEPEWRAWRDMRSRCRRSFRWYENVSVCDRWSDYELFLQDMGPRPGPGWSIDRIDTRGNYCPENCRWATWHTQNRNRRSNRMVTIDGVTKCIADWSTGLGLSRTAVKARLALGWSTEEAVTTPRLRKRGV